MNQYGQQGAKTSPHNEARSSRSVSLIRKSSKAAVTQIDHLLPIVIAAAALVFYGAGAVPHANGGNWGEFQTFGYMGGIAHSPTYPLLTASIWLITHLVRFLEPAHAANLTNAGFAAAATTLLFIASRDLTRSHLAALISTIVFATAYSTWNQAVQAEVFSLQTAILLGTIVTLRRYRQQPSPSRASLVCFATGLSLTNHGLSIFMLPVTVLYLVTIRPLPNLTIRNIARYIISILLGLSPWLYLIRARFFSVPISAPQNETILGLRDIGHLVVGKPLADTEGGGILSFLFSNPTLVADRSDVLLAGLTRDFGWPWLLVASVGIGLLFKGDWRLGIWIVFTAFCSAIFTFAYQIPDYHRYFTVHVALLSLGLAVGISWLSTIFIRSMDRINKRGRRISSPILSVILLALIVIHLISLLHSDARASIAGHRYHAAVMTDNGLRQLAHMEPNSVYMVDWTSSWHVRYPIYARNMFREKNLDIRTVNYNTMGIEQADEILYSGRRLYLQRVTPEFARKFDVVPQGAFFQIFLHHELPDGQLVKGSDEKIYLISNNTRRWIPTGEIFVAYGYRWDRVRHIRDKDLNAIAIGPPLPDPR